MKRSKLRTIIKEEIRRLNEETTSEDYTDRLIGAGLDKKGTIQLANYYLENPNEIPEPMKFNLYKQNFKKIINILKKTPSSKFS